jgi:hypothetical protein
MVLFLLVLDGYLLHLGIKLWFPMLLPNVSSNGFVVGDENVVEHYPAVHRPKVDADPADQLEARFRDCHVLRVRNLPCSPHALVIRVLNQGSLPFAFVFWVQFEGRFPHTASAVFAFRVVNLSWRPFPSVLLVPILGFSMIRIIDFKRLIVKPILIQSSRPKIFIKISALHCASIMDVS